MPLSITNRASASDAAATTVTLASFANSQVSPLYVVVVWQALGSVSSVTFNGVALTAVAGPITTTGVGSLQAFELLTPAATTADIVATLSTLQGVAVLAIATSGGDTATGHRSVSTRTDSDGSGPGLTYTPSVADDIVLHAAYVFALTITFDGGEDTTSTEFENLFSSSLSCGIGTKTATGANTAVGCTDEATYLELAFSIIPAPGGGGGGASLMGQRFYVNG